VKVLVRRQWNHYRIAEADLAGLTNLHWETISGGVRTSAPQPFIHGYVYCDELAGEIAHSCQHGSGPHAIKVAVVKKDNTPQVWAEVLERAGPRPSQRRYNPRDDAQAVVNALVNGSPHSGLERRKEIFVIKPIGFSNIAHGLTAHLGRSRRLKAQVIKLVASHPEFEQVKYGNMLAFRRIPPK